MNPVIKEYNPCGVDESVLRGTDTRGWLSRRHLRNDPIESYLEGDESAIFALSNAKSGVEYEHETRDERKTVRPGDGYRAFAIVTDSRLLFIVGDNRNSPDEVDYSVSIPLADITVIEKNEGILSGELVVVTSAEVRWRFPCRDDLDPVVSYLEVASTTWMRVEKRLHGARKRLVDASQRLESGAYDDAMAAVRDASAAVERARRREQRFCEGGVPAMGAHIERVEERIADVRVEVLRARATHRVDTAEKHWRQDEYDAAYRVYSDARDDYQEILAVTGSDFEATAEIDDRLTRVERNLTYLERAPIDSAETARHRAAEADDAAERVHHLQRALECYRAALELDWGQDIKRFECDTASVRDRIDDVASALVAARRAQASQRLAVADEHADAGRSREARVSYQEALEPLDDAREVARELVPDAEDDLLDVRRTIEQRLSGLETDSATDAVPNDDDTAQWVG